VFKAIQTTFLANIRQKLYQVRRFVRYSPALYSSEMLIPTHQATYAAKPHQDEVMDVATGRYHPASCPRDRQREGKTEQPAFCVHVVGVGI